MSMMPETATNPGMVERLERYRKAAQESAKATPPAR